MRQTIIDELNSHKDTIEKTINIMVDDIQKASETIINALKAGKKVILCGNGGSAADAQHIAAELTGRYKTERASLPAIALTTDTSALTAIGNDYGYDKVFVRQAEAFVQEGDIVIGISTSGNSQNVVEAFELANKRDAITIAMSGRDGGKMKSHADINLIVPSDNTPRIQEMHILIGHTICQIIDDNFTHN
jgi:D-sedoheptulose 7-phosphate isomerase